ncbi:MAG: peptidylprolyl isomerase [Pseudomonadota bacterium]
MIYPHKILRLTIAFLTLFWFSTNTFAQGLAIDQVLVIVNDEPITLLEYGARHQREALQGTGGLSGFRGEVSAQLLETMILERIQAQQATQIGISVTDAEVDQAVAFVASQNQLTADELLVQLDRDGITPSDFRNSLREQRLIQRLIDASVNSRVNISDTEIENYLQNHKELLSTNEAFEISHLFRSTSGLDEEQVKSLRTETESLRKSLLAGDDFEAAVNRFSDGDVSDGGYLGWRKVNQLPELFLSALRKTNTGGVSQVIPSENGFHLLKLHQKEGGGEIIQQYRVRHILVQPGADTSNEEAQNDILKMREQLAQGESFESLARRFSDDSSSKAEGGELGWLGPGESDPGFEQAMITLPIGELSDPVKTRFGFHLIEVLERRNVDLVETRARRQARQQIFQRKASEIFDDWSQSLRNSAYVEYVGIEI